MLDAAIRWTRVSALIADAIGLHFPDERLPDLQRGLEAVASELGFDDAEAYTDWMLTASLSPADLRVLAAHLTIGETYFCRDAKLFDALARTVLPALLRAREGTGRRLRLWSAGCCSGEEAYSLAILVHQLIPDLSRWRVSILATDINTRFLRKAAAGTYGEWSFRSTPDGFKERWFQRTPDGQYQIAPEVRQLVTFAPGNLVEDEFPALATETNAMDLVLCRNVLMYFTPSQARKVAGKLRRALAEDGWLAVSPSEASRDLFSPLAVRNFPGVVLFTKHAGAGGPHELGLQAPNVCLLPFAEPDPPSDGLKPSAHDTPALEPIPVPAVEPATLGGAGDVLPQARALANEGRLTEALALCDDWLAAEKSDAAGHYLRALVLLELGDADAASSALQRALYLNPSLAAAHFTFGNLARRRGCSAQSDRHFRNALHVLALSRPEEPVPESDGLSAARLAEIIRELISLERPA
jgi:chemotaxis protein methyltransferase CheR